MERSNEETEKRTWTRRELNKRIRKGLREARASDRRFRRAFHVWAGRKTWWQRLRWNVELSGWRPSKWR